MTMSEDNFNKLTPAETELLFLLAEEAGEVLQAVGKIGRHGYESSFGGGPNNRDYLEKELADFLVVYDLLLTSGRISAFRVAAHMADKQQWIGKYLHHQSQA